MTLAGAAALWHEMRVQVQWILALVWLLLRCAASPAAPPPTSATAASGEQSAPSAAPAEGVPPRALPALRVATSGDYAPFTTRGATGALSGFDVEVAEKLAADLGYELVWVPFRWPTLRAQIESGELDVAMGGISWQPIRATRGFMTRAVAVGGPCVLGDTTAARLAVNRGGVLEAWARRRFGDRQLVVVDDNQSLPSLLEARTVGAIITDSFERRAFQRPGWGLECEPPSLRKVYWVAPGRASELGPRIEAWLKINTAAIQAAQERWFGERQPLDARVHVLDLLARRLELMPLIAELKAARGLSIEDVAREREVLDTIAMGARERGLPEAEVRELFALQIELGKRVQRRASRPPRADLAGIELAAHLRPAVDELGRRILDALRDARSSPAHDGAFDPQLPLLAAWLDAAERAELAAKLRALAIL